MFIIKLSKHDRYVQKLCMQIKDSYDTIDTHVAFDNSKRRMAEVDVIAKRGDVIDVYEVKCSYRIIKAKKQLKRIKRIMSNLGTVNLFFFCGASSSIEEIVI